MLHAEGMLHTRPDLAVFDIVPRPAAGAIRGLTSSRCAVRPEFRRASASAVVPETGHAAEITGLVSVSMMTCTFAKSR